MKNNRVNIVITSYNCEQHIEALLKSIMIQNTTDIQVIVADDGSSDNTVKVIESFKDKLDLIILELEHGERGIARRVGIEKALEVSPEFILIIDADMILQKNLIRLSRDKMNRDDSLDALIIKEIPYSNYHNFYTKVKLFEREVINNGCKVSQKHSIEAARFWRSSSFVKTGGINDKQIAFEEIQPTLRCFEQNGKIEKLMETGLYHDEKKVTLRNILEKKNYYFSKLSITTSSEKGGLSKALTRFYLFRPVYYTPKNLLAYVKHPLLFMGMINMYVLLTIIAAYHMIVPLLDQLKGRTLLNE